MCTNLGDANMMLNLQALEQALTKISHVGKGEVSLTVDGQTLVLRVLTPDEDIAATEYARLDDTEDEEIGTLTFLERYKRACLAYSIVQIGDLDLRNVDKVETGEVLENGTAVWVPKHVAVRQVVEGWSRTLMMFLFQKYSDLLNRVEIEAQKAVLYEPADLEAEIDRAKKRVQDLERERERMDALGKNPARALAENITQAGKDVAELGQRRVAVASGQKLPTPQPSRQEVAPASPEPPPQQEVVEPPAPRPRERVMPSRVAPPERQAAPPPVVAPEEAPEPPQAGFEGIVNSMGDDEDALRAETARLQAARAAARKASVERAREDLIPTAVARRTPPHRAAANTADAVLDTGADRLKAARPATPPPGADGVETFRLPPTELTDRGGPRRESRSGEKMGVDEVAPATNPRFQRPQR